MERARGRGRPAAGTNDRAAECLTRRGIVRVQPARTRRPHHPARRIPDRRTRSIREDLRYRTVRQRRLFPDAAHSHSRGRHLQQRSVDAAVLESARHPRVRRSLLPLGESHRSCHDVVRHAAGPPRRDRRRRWRRDGERPAVGRAANRLLVHLQPVLAGSVLPRAHGVVASGFDGRHPRRASGNRAAARGLRGSAVERARRGVDRSAARQHDSAHALRIDGVAARGDGSIRRALSARRVTNARDRRANGARRTNRTDSRSSLVRRPQ